MPRTVSVKITPRAYKLAKQLAALKGCFIGKVIAEAIAEKVLREIPVESKETVTA